MKPAQTRPALTRSIPFWILVVASIGLVAGGAVVIGQHLGTMTKTLGDGSATGLEVYAGQSWIVVGAALLGVGALGVLLALALATAASLIRAAAPAAPAAAEDAPAPFTDVVDPDGALDAPATAREIADAGIPATDDGSSAADDEPGTVREAALTPVDEPADTLSNR